MIKLLKSNLSWFRQKYIIVLVPLGFLLFFGIYFGISAHNKNNPIIKECIVTKTEVKRHDSVSANSPETTYSLYIDSSNCPQMVWSDIGEKDANYYHNLLKEGKSYKFGLPRIVLFPGTENSIVRIYGNGS